MEEKKVSDVAEQTSLRGILDVRLVGIALRYSYPRETAAIDLALDELTKVVMTMPRWLVETIKSDAADYLLMQRTFTLDKYILNEGYANRVIQLCDGRLQNEW